MFVMCYVRRIKSRYKTFAYKRPWDNIICEAYLVFAYTRLIHCVGVIVGRCACACGNDEARDVQLYVYCSIQSIYIYIKYSVVYTTCIFAFIVGIRESYPLFDDGSTKTRDSVTCRIHLSCRIVEMLNVK